MRTQTPRTDAVRQTSAWAERGARLGFGARGLTYLLLGWLSIEIALRRSHRQASDSGAFALLAGHVWGVAILVVMAIGFGGFAVWSLTVALGGLRRFRLRLTHKEVEPVTKSGAKRAAALGRAIVYGFLCYLAIGLATGAGHGSSGDPAPLAARAMREPAGQLLVAVAGAVLIIAGLALVWRASKRRFMDDMRTEEMTNDVKRVVGTLGLIGSVARGLVVALLGIFLLVAGVTHKPGQAKGLDASLVTLAHQPFGVFALIAVAAGLGIFGVFSVLEARYCRT